MLPMTMTLHIERVVAACSRFAAGRSGGPGTWWPAAGDQRSSPGAASCRGSYHRLNPRRRGGIFSNRGAAGMNHWKETAEILSRLAELGAAGRRAALATVVEIVGSAYRRPGAKFLIEDTGSTLGSVSGGCLEADVREVANAVVETRTPSLRHY